jgi:uncharacterized protein YuzE
MAVYTCDGDADVLYVLLVDEPEPAIDRTEEIGPNLHVDLDAQGKVVGVDFSIPAPMGTRSCRSRRDTGSL